MSQTTTTTPKPTRVALGGTHNKAMHLVASVLGVYGGLLGLEHGYFEALQGNVAPAGLVISAIGPPCQPSRAWHGCEPALTVLPSFLVSGVLAMLIAQVVIGWAGRSVQRRHGGIMLLLLTCDCYLLFQAYSSRIATG